MKTFGKVVFAILLTVASGLVAFLLAGFGQGLALQLGCTNCTPGMIAANRLAPPDQAHTFDVLSKQVSIGVAIDTPIWFVIICGILIAIAVKRQRRKNAQNASNPT